MNLVVFFFLALVLTLSQQKCAFTRLPNTRLPIAYDGEAYPVNYTMTACEEYIEDNVCCS